MKPELFGHPFSSYTWKVLIALYEREVDFTFHILGSGNEPIQKRFEAMTITGQFPVLLDNLIPLVESNIIIEYLDLQYTDAPPMVPTNAFEALKVRMLADVFDDYIQSPMQTIVGNALRPQDEKDPRGVKEARQMLERAYDWLETRLETKAWAFSETWACGERFSLADCAAAPALFYSDWVHPISENFKALNKYRTRLLARPSVAQVVDEARPFRSFFPLEVPDKD